MVLSPNRTPETRSTYEMKCVAMASRTSSASSANHEKMGSLVTSALALEEAKELFGICGTRKLKLTRHHIQADELNVLVEEFGDNLSPLTIIQVEMLTRNNTETFPAWIGEEITGQADYNYANLASYGLPGHFYAWSRTRHGLKVAS